MTEQGRNSDPEGNVPPDAGGGGRVSPHEPAMSMIFDSFPDRDAAERFAAGVKRIHNREAVVFDTVAESDAHDVFPFDLTPPIVHVERLYPIWDEKNMEAEQAIEQLVQEFGGEFAGT